MSKLNPMDNGKPKTKEYINLNICRILKYIYIYILLCTKGIWLPWSTHLTRKRRRRGSFSQRRAQKWRKCFLYRCVSGMKSNYSVKRFRFLCIYVSNIFFTCALSCSGGSVIYLFFSHCQKPLTFIEQKQIHILAHISSFLLASSYKLCVGYAI